MSDVISRGRVFGLGLRIFSAQRANLRPIARIQNVDFLINEALCADYLYFCLDLFDFIWFNNKKAAVPKSLLFGTAASV